MPLVTECPWDGSRVIPGKLYSEIFRSDKFSQRWKWLSCNFPFSFRLLIWIAIIADNYRISAGWTVTLAGTYGEDMAPDVEMRLSFPKKSPPPSSVNVNKVYRFPSHQKYFDDSLSHRDTCSYDSYATGNGNHAALLPPPNGNYNNPKRSLSRNILDGIIRSIVACAERREPMKQSKHM